MDRTESDIPQYLLCLSLPQQFTDTDFQSPPPIQDIQDIFKKFKILPCLGTSPSIGPGYSSPFLQLNYVGQWSYQMVVQHLMHKLN